MGRMGRMGPKCCLHLSFTICILLSWGSFSRFGKCRKTYGKVFGTRNAEGGTRNWGRFYCIFQRFDALAGKVY
jgi:hypothetical protein